MRLSTCFGGKAYRLCQTGCAMDDHAAAPVAADARRQPSRRGFLIVSGVLVVGAAGAGVAVGVASTKDSGGHDLAEKVVPTVPQALDDAIDAEHGLLATVTAGINGATGHDKRLLAMIKADHTAHLRALDAAKRVLLGADPLPSPSPADSSPPPSDSDHPGASTLGRKAVRISERDAAKAAAARAAQLTGRNAALLASIAASEATHAEVLG